MKRRLFTILSILSLLLCVATAALWVRSQWSADALTFTALGRFFDCSAAARGISIHWLMGVPKDEMPPGDALGWRSRAVPAAQQAASRTPHDGAFINEPEARLQRKRLCGAEVSWGSGQILLPVWFLFRASPMLPLRGISLSWGTILACCAIIPGIQLIRRIRRAWLRRQSRRQGLCRKCGYDLRASSERCPECGTSIPADLIRKPAA